MKEQIEKLPFNFKTKTGTGFPFQNARSKPLTHEGHLMKTWFKSLNIRGNDKFII